jgi:hypothetical protein
MERCKKFEKLIKEYISGELSSTKKSSLQAHLKECKSCRGIFELHQILEKDLVTFPEVTEESFVKMRQNVIRNIRRKESEIPIPWYQVIVDQLTYFLRKPAFVAAVAVVLFLVGFFSRNLIIPSNGDTNSAFIRQINYSAEKNDNLAAVENSPYLYSDVKFRDLDGQNIALSFNVTTHLELTRKKDDPLVKEVLTQSLLNQESVGNRLNALSYAKEIIDPKIKEALIYTMENDPSISVRMEAMTSLAGYPNDEEIQSAFLKILGEEEQVQMRLMAIEYLTNNQTDEKLLKDAIKELNQPKDAAVRYKLNQYLKN